MQSGWSARIVTFGVWSLVAASAAYWSLRLGASAPAPAAMLALPGNAAPDTAAIARMLGAGAAGVAAAPVVPAGPVATPLAARFTLHGIAAGADPRRSGVAVIGVDGKPPRPYGAGARLEDGVMVQSIQPRSVTLASSRDGPALLTLELAGRR